MLIVAHRGLLPYEILWIEPIGDTRYYSVQALVYGSVISVPFTAAREELAPLVNVWPAQPAA